LHFNFICLQEPHIPTLFFIKIPSKYKQTLPENYLVISKTN